MAGRWIRASVDVFDKNHDLSPGARAESACSGWAWLSLVAQAEWRDRSDLRRGQLRASVRDLAALWRWDKNRVARFLDSLEEAGRILRHRSGHLPTVITIVNYETYQRGNGFERDSIRDTSADSDADSHADSHAYTYPQIDQQKRGQSAPLPVPLPLPEQQQLHMSGESPLTTPRDTLSEDFETFWNRYPKRAGGNPKGKAEKVYRARRREGVTAEALFKGVDAFHRYHEARGTLKTEWVKQTQFWLSPTYRGWEQDWSVPEEPMSNMGFAEEDFE